MYDSSIQELLSSTSGGVLRLTLNRPKESNALTYAMMKEMHGLLTTAAEDWDIRAIVLEAKGNDFCVGEDRETMGEIPGEIRHRIPGGLHGPAPVLQQSVLKALRQMQKPTICLLTGNIRDAGLDLICATDIRLASANVTIADTRVRNARFSATGLTYILPRLIGQSQAMRILLKGDLIKAAEAERIGLVYAVFEKETFDEKSEELISELAQMPTRAYGLIKQQIQEQLDLPYDAALMHSLAVRQTNVIEDIAEGGKAFREKRKPNFRGR